jgi:hypothetical protein
MHAGPHVGSTAYAHATTKQRFFERKQKSSTRAYTWQLVETRRVVPFHTRIRQL